jgi:hypothetical protein
VPVDSRPEEFLEKGVAAWLSRLKRCHLGELSLNLSADAKWKLIFGTIFSFLIHNPV